MLTIGRYRIAFGWARWIQFYRPTTIWCPFGLIWIFREARPTDVDKKKRFPLSTSMMYGGKKYYYREVGEDIPKGIVWQEEVRSNANTN